MLSKRNCSFDLQFDYCEYNEPKHHESYLFNLIFKFNFLLCTYFQSINDKIKGNFVHILEYQKEKVFCSKYYITGFYKENKFWEIKFQNENTERKFFEFDKILTDIKEEIVLLNKLFPNILDDPLKEKIPKETTVYQIYQKTIQILKDFKEEGKQKHDQMFSLKETKELVNLQKFKDPENFNSSFENKEEETRKGKKEDHYEDKEKPSKIEKKTKIPRQIKVKGKILNIPEIWVKYKIKCWNDFEIHVKNNIEDFLSTENINPKILETALKTIKFSSFIIDEKDLDFGEINHANFFGRAIDAVWDFIRIHRGKTIKIKNKEFKIPSCWDEYNINDFLGFQEIVKAGMMRQFAKTKKLTPTLIKIVEEMNLENSIALDKELDLNSEEHIYFIKRKMLNALAISNEQ